MVRSNLIDELPQALRDYENISRNNQNSHLLLRSDYTSEWEKERDMFIEYPRIIDDYGYIPNLDIFIDIAVWKLGGNAGRNISNLSENTTLDVKHHTKAAHNTTDVEAGIEHLTELNGIGPAAATGLYTFFDPAKYTPMDSLALEALNHHGFDLPNQADVQYYPEYCRLCRNVWDESELTTLRDVDRALWAIGRELSEE